MTKIILYDENNNEIKKAHVYWLCIETTANNFSKTSLEITCQKLNQKNLFTRKLSEISTSKMISEFLFTYSY